MEPFGEDLWEEVDRLVRNATTSRPSDEEPTFKSIRQWQALFGYSHEEARSKIRDHRTSLDRLGITDDAWEELRLGKEAEGHDKESFEHYLATPRKTVGTLIRTSPNPSQRTAVATYLLKLEGRLSDPEYVQCILGSAEPLKVETDDDDKSLRFCRLTAKERSILLMKLSFTPLLISLSSPAKKNLDPNSKFPSLGLDSTLPQHRLEVSSEKALPSPDQYPVWYFFYGTLAVPAKLSKLLAVPEEAIGLHRASITGGKMSSWGDEYRALLDGDHASAVTIDGSGFLVRSEEEEDILRGYETDKYEVVRCQMILADTKEMVPACVFRYVG